MSNNPKKTCPSCFRKVDCDQGGFIVQHETNIRPVYGTYCFGTNKRPLEESDDSLFEELLYLDFTKRQVEKNIEELKLIDEIDYLDISNRKNPSPRKYKKGEEDFEKVIDSIIAKQIEKLTLIEKRFTEIKLKVE